MNELGAESQERRAKSGEPDKFANILALSSPLSALGSSRRRSFLDLAKLGDRVDDTFLLVRR